MRSLTSRFISVTPGSCRVSGATASHRWFCIYTFYEDRKCIQSSVFSSWIMTHFVSADGIYKWVESLDSTWWNIIALTFVPSLFVMLRQRWVICLLNPLFIVTVLWLARNMWVFLQLLISSWYFPVFSLNWLIRQAGSCLSSIKINGQ